MTSNDSKNKDDINIEDKGENEDILKIEVKKSRKPQKWSEEHEIKGDPRKEYVPK